MSKQWFCEDDDDELRFCYVITEQLAKVTSPYQNIKVVQSLAYGKMLVIDDVVMITSRDEFVYREMIAHVPMCNHSAPQTALVIGGGDGGVVRELTKYSCLQKIVMCEIDEAVVAVCREYFPQLTAGLEDARVELLFADGLKFLRESPAAQYDLIIVDSTDPVGPGECLFTQEFYTSVARALKADGIMCAQTESLWHKNDLLQRIATNISSAFAFSARFTATVPTYPRAHWTWTLASHQQVNPAEYDDVRFARVSDKLRYLTADLMVSCFHLPKFALSTQ